MQEEKGKKKGSSKGASGDKKGSKKGKGDKGDDKAVKEYFLTAQSQSLDLTSPAGEEGTIRELWTGKGTLGRGESAEGLAKFRSHWLHCFFLLPGKYQLNLAHPASHLVVKHLADLMTQLAEANAQGLVSGRHSQGAAQGAEGEVFTWNGCGCRPGIAAVELWVWI